MRTPKLRNQNQIAELFDVGPWRIRYLLQSRRYIKPAVVLPSMRLFDEKAVGQIKAELKVIEARQSRHQNVIPVGSGAAATPVASA